MPTYSFEKSAFWLPIKDWAHRPCFDALISSMQHQGYSAKLIVMAMRFTSRFIAWLHAQAQDGGRELGYSDIDRFISYRTSNGELRNGERRALKRLHAQLVEAGVITPPLAPYDPPGQLLDLFVVDLRRRGYRELSIASFRWFCARFLGAVWADATGVAQLGHGDVRSYIERQAPVRSKATANIMCSRIRVFLRFLWRDGYVSQDLATGVPAARSIRLSALPSFMNPIQLDQVLSSCDRTTVAGRRDYAVLLLLARIGLRAKEAACLTLDDIDWRAGTIRVDGKGGRIATMPLASDVGEAIIDYVRNGRPPSSARTIFHRVETPRTPFTAATPVILIARRALKRAGVTGLRSLHAHVFRHTLATGMIRSGASLTEIGQVLRHQDPNTSRIYAKVDIATLRTLCLPWPGAAQ